MQIKTITVEKLKNLGNFSHIKLSATAEVEDYESPIKAMEKLKKYIDEQIEGVEENSIF